MATKTYTIIARHDLTGMTIQTFTGTLDQLKSLTSGMLARGQTEYYEKEHLPAKAYKINQNPKSISSLISALNKSYTNGYEWYNGPVIERWSVVSQNN